jgi:hypothetical protein
LQTKRLLRSVQRYKNKDCARDWLKNEWWNNLKENSYKNNCMYYKMNCNIKKISKIQKHSMISTNSMRVCLARQLNTNCQCRKNRNLQKIKLSMTLCSQINSRMAFQISKKAITMTMMLIVIGLMTLSIICENFCFKINDYFFFSFWLMIVIKLSKIMFAYQRELSLYLLYT